MRRLAVVIAIFVGVAACLQAYASNFTLASPDITAGQWIAKRYVYNGLGCTGQNVSPILHWSDAPKGTKSFVVTIYDPDAPTGAGWWHWIVVNIPASIQNLPRGAGDPGGKGIPKGAIQLRNDYGGYGYGGPCPPKSATPHHYEFKVFAMDVSRLPVTAKTTPKELGHLIHRHELGVAELIARYGR